MNHIDLFSGIGGFAIAAGWAGFRTVQFVEIDPFCQQVLQHHWPGVPVHDDIRTIPTESLDAWQRAGVTLLTGGFPCQPFSVAGQRLGQADDRALWPEMRRVIGHARPRWVVAENVPGLLTLGIGVCLADLEAIGYTCGTVVLPACAVGAPHIRERLFLVAYSSSHRSERVTQREACVSTASRIPSHADGFTCPPWVGHQPLWARPVRAGGPGRGAEHWLAAVDQPGRVDDGVPAGMAEDGYRAYGNAVVPQVAYPILKWICEWEKTGR